MRLISESEDLVQGVADSKLPILAQPAVVESLIFLSEDVWQQNAKAASRWGALQANVCPGRCSWSWSRSAPVQVRSAQSETAPCPYAFGYAVC